VGGSYFDRYKHIAELDQKKTCQISEISDATCGGFVGGTNAAGLRQKRSLISEHTALAADSNIQE